MQLNLPRVIKRNVMSRIWDFGGLKVIVEFLCAQLKLITCLQAGRRRAAISFNFEFLASYIIQGVENYYSLQALVLLILFINGERSTFLKIKGSPWKDGIVRLEDDKCIIRKYKVSMHEASLSFTAKKNLDLGKAEYRVKRSSRI